MEKTYRYPYVRKLNDNNKKENVLIRFLLGKFVFNPTKRKFFSVQRYLLLKPLIIHEVTSQ